MVVFVVVALVAAWVLPRILRALRSEHDLFLLLSVGSALALAGLGARYFGVPLALAAFVAGLAVGESSAAAEARRRILPFRDLFAVLFFVLLGSLIDPRSIPAGVRWLALLLGGVVFAKVIPILVLGKLVRMRGVRSWQLAVGLGQVGEFSFVLGSLALGHGLIPRDLYTALLATVVLTIGISTILARLGGGQPPSPAVSEGRISAGT
jgi:CPA2 family monovalent cation:H+ antiporter-2